MRRRERAFAGLIFIALPLYSRLFQGDRPGSSEREAILEIFTQIIFVAAVPAFTWDFEQGRAIAAVVTIVDPRIARL
ncbi:hypothetical protein P4S72_15825 [Vibrio sp. PP-XX7]